jgi:lipopolysaccharide export system protein LptA
MGLLGGAGLLVCVIGAFLWYAHHRARGWLTGLPGKLGVNIKSEAGEVSYSHSVLGKTVYTIHAAKQVEYKDGKVALHDVDMTLYGAKGDRADRVYGKEFEYDQKTGVVRAIGEVHIDLQAPAAAPAPEGAGAHAASASGINGHLDAVGPQVIHVTTSNLVYVEKLGVAATSEPIEFHLAQMTGHAVGADYSSDSNVLVLQTAVDMTGIAGGRPVKVTATRAVLDQRSQRTDLTEAKYDSLGETVQADTAVVYTRSDGSVERIEATGHVIGAKDGTTVTASNSNVLLNAKSQPQSAHLTGEIAYQSDEPLRQARGKANESTIAFDAQGQPSHAVLVGGVDLLERIRASQNVREPWSTRELTAAKVEAALASAPVSTTASTSLRKSELRDVDATGGAHLMLVDNGTLGKPPREGDGSTELAGDELTAHFAAAALKGKAETPKGKEAKAGPKLETLEGRGHTLLRQATQGGIEQSSAGDALDVKFRPIEKKTASGVTRQLTDEVQRAVQQGHVAMTRKAPAKGVAKNAGPANARVAPQFDEEHATAERAVYDGDSDRLTLTGSVQMNDQANVLWANQIAFEHVTGDAQAEGSVKAIYQSPTGQQKAGQQQAGQGGGAPGANPSNPPEPAHILADHADLKHEENTATFYGRAGKPVRLWQGPSQVEAPVIELSRDNLGDQRLAAHGLEPTARTPWNGDGDGPVAAAPVHAVLVTMGSKSAGPKKPTVKTSEAAKPGKGAPGGGTAAPPSVIRIASRELVYSDLLREADFAGGVRVDGKDGTMRSRQATVYLQNPGIENWGLEIPDATPGGASTSVARSPVKQAVASGDETPGELNSFSGSVERVIATGHIEIEQPGRRATGERLVYTASDGWSVLTGDPAALPKLVDATQGTITGVSLRFQTGDDSVLVSNALPGAEKAVPGQRVHSETRLHTDGDKKPKGQKR